MLQHALKEWSIAVDTLVQGKTILLLRKGGIREVGQHFRVPYQRVWLYPTYEHQKTHLLKPEWASQITSVSPGWHPNRVILQAWAEITHVWTIQDLAAVEALLPFHIWTPQFVTERFRWKPNQPLHLLLLRVQQLKTPVELEWQPAFGGCRSWLTLENPVSSSPALPVLDESTFAKRVEQLRHQIEQVETNVCE